MKTTLTIALASIALIAAPVQAAPDFSFGTDNGEYANDGECDDPRFEGPGMTPTVLLSDDLLNDASDCRAAFKAGTIKLRGVDENGVPDFGDDSGEYANDGECDDMRFTGSGMTATALLSDDIMRDATDCGSAYASGKIQLLLK